MKQYIFLFLAVMPLFCCCTSCESKKTPPVNLGGTQQQGNIVSVEYSELNGDKTIPVKVNGMTMDMIFDTGCSGLHMSLTELQLLVKNDKLESSDILGSSYSQIADGSIVQNGEILLREVEIARGIVLYNVRASVALNQTAPVLLGNGVLDELASYEVDNITHTINFKKK